MLFSSIIFRCCIMLMSRYLPLSSLAPSLFATDAQWLQIDIGPPALISAVKTKGRGDSKRPHWVKRFMVSYSNDSEVWYQYKDAHHLDPKVRGPLGDLALAHLAPIALYLLSLHAYLLFQNM